MQTPDPIAFSIFGIDIRWYGVLIATGIALAVLWACRRAPRHSLKSDDILDVVIFAVPAGIIGARLYYVLFRWEWYAGDIHKILDIRAGGLAIHGGLILAFLTAYIVCRYKKISFLDGIDTVVPGIALAQAIGRWGNFFNGEAHGGETDLPWAVIIDGTGYHPTFLYESIWCFLLFFILWKIDNNRKFPGQVICTYGMLYSVERFLVEGLRTDSLMIGPFRQAQVLSLTVIIVCAVLYAVLRRRSRAA